jgi:predicted Zn-dependent peptidase
MLSFTLPGGIRVFQIPSKNPIAHCALYIKSGARDEMENEHGVAHLVEHMLFKGTTRRKPYHILSRLDSVGGEINAFTSKEETCVYASFLNPYFKRAVELIFDIAFHSTFPEKELAREKAVVLEEIESYKDSPSEQIFDDFEDVIFAGHPLGRNILGTPESIAEFSRDDLFSFVQRTHLQENMILVIAGSFSENQIRRCVEPTLPEKRKQSAKVIRSAPENYKPGNIVLQQDTHQTHLITGNRAYSFKDEKNLCFSLLNNILGGPALNNRLNLNIREKYGFAYHVESYYNAYSDTGLFGIYLGTDYKHIDQSIRLIKKELHKLMHTKLGSLQLHRAKKQYVGQMLLQQDNKLNYLLALGKSLIYQTEPESFLEVEKKLYSINAEDIMEVANEIFEPANMSTLVYSEKK